MKNREKDQKVEREVAAFLDENLYSKLDIFEGFERTDTKEEQISGSDLILSTSDGLLYKKVIDEKVAIRYANTGLETFALELSFINRNGSEMIGWFLDHTKKTEYYLLGWITKADIPFDKEKKRWDVYSINRNNIRELDWVLVSRRKIMKFLEESGWTLDRITRQCNKIRKNEGVRTNGFISNVSFRYSPTYVEKPINILLKKSTFFELADLKGKISV